MEAGIEKVREVRTISQLESAITCGECAITEDAALLCQAEGIDAVIEVTGTVEFGAHVVLQALEHHKHVIMMNAELDGTIGPILKIYADKAGVVLTNSDGDQPGVIMNLYRFVKGIESSPFCVGTSKVCTIRIAIRRPNKILLVDGNRSRIWLRLLLMAQRSHLSKLLWPMLQA